MSEYTLKYKISNDELLELIKLDAKCYNEEYNRGTFDKCLSWYNKNDEIYICLLHNDKIVGYINFCPLTDQAYQEYRNLNLHDYDLTQNHIPKYQDNTDVKCLFMSIVISEEHRDGEAIKCLLKGLENKLIDLKNRGINITHILSECVSSAGEKVTKRLGFRKIKLTNNCSFLYEILGAHKLTFEKE